MTRVRMPIPTQMCFSIALASSSVVYATGGTFAHAQESLFSNVDPRAQVIRPVRADTDLIVDPKAKKWIKFEALVKKWREQRGATSSITKAAMTPAYLGIIGMGEEAVPLIIEQIKSEGDDPDQWFWALESITGVNPSRPEDKGKYLKIAQAWLRWDEENNAG